MKRPLGLGRQNDRVLFVVIGVEIVQALCVVLKLLKQVVLIANVLGDLDQVLVLSHDVA